MELSGKNSGKVYSRRKVIIAICFAGSILIVAGLWFIPNFIAVNNLRKTAVTVLDYLVGERDDLPEEILLTRKQFKELLVNAGVKDADWVVEIAHDPYTVKNKLIKLRPAVMKKFTEWHSSETHKNTSDKKAAFSSGRTKKKDCR